MRVPRPYVVEVTFNDGTVRRVDLEPELWGPVFEPLRDPALFAQAAIDADAGSVAWPTGAALAPEFLYYGEETPYGSCREDDVADVDAESVAPAAREAR